MSVSLRAAGVFFLSAVTLAMAPAVSSRVPAGSAKAGTAPFLDPPSTMDGSASTQLDGEKMGSCGDDAQDAVAATSGTTSGDGVEALG